MKSKTKILGHPVHPILIGLPLGLFITAVLCDIIYLLTNNTFFSLVSFFNLAGGVLGGTAAAVIGTRDSITIPAGTRAKNIGMIHGLGNCVLLLVFLMSWFLRQGNPNYTPSAVALAFSFAGIVLIGLTVWLGGEMVYHLGVAEDDGANLNAPSSLSRKPASSGGVPPY